MTTGIYFKGLFVSSTTDAAPFPLASFNDSRCAAGGVHLTDPLLFYCELHEVFALKVVLPTGDVDVVSLGDTHTGIALPAGFTAVSLDITEHNIYTRNIALTLSLMNASLLKGGEIRCDDTVRNTVMAGCSIASPSPSPSPSKLTCSTYYA